MERGRWLRCNDAMFVIGSCATTSGGSCGPATAALSVEDSSTPLLFQPKP